MSYHVGRNGQALGQFTEAEIRAGLGSGIFFTSDFAWREDMTGWKRLDQVFGFAAAQSLSAPMSGYGPIAVRMPEGNVGVGIMPAPGTAIASLVLGIAALVGFFLCLIGGVLAVPGAICGHMALNRIRRSEGMLEGRGMAIAGLVTSYATIVIGMLLAIIFGVVFAIAGTSGAK